MKMIAIQYKLYLLLAGHANAVAVHDCGRILQPSQSHVLREAVPLPLSSNSVELTMTLNPSPSLISPLVTHLNLRA